MSNDVAIIGVGLHPFGRFDKTAMQMGADAIQLALKDAGVEWGYIQFGFGGSHEISNPDAVTRLVGLTGITFTNVFNACATAASAIQQTADQDHQGSGLRHSLQALSEVVNMQSRLPAARQGMAADARDPVPIFLHFRTKS